MVQRRRACGWNRPRCRFSYCRWIGCARVLEPDTFSMFRLDRRTEEGRRSTPIDWPIS